MSETYLSAAIAADLSDGDKIGVTLNGWPILVGRNEGQLFAVINRCSHAASALVEGRVRRGAVMCPLHGARFELASGRCVGGSYPALKTFGVRVVDGEVQVAVPDDRPSAEHLPVMPV